MNNLAGFINNSHVNSNSYVEKTGDFLLTPTRVVFKGKKFILLEKDSKTFRYERT